MPSREARRDEPESVHTLEHCDLIERAGERDAFRISSDTYMCPDTKLAAALSAGTLLEITALVMRGELKNGFAVIRPPGHHAERGEAMGFCMYNNVAVAAQVAQRQWGAERILVFDWDIHHGNGTQHIFEADADVAVADSLECLHHRQRSFAKL